MEDVDGARRSQKLRARREAARAKLDKEGRKTDVGNPPQVLAEMKWRDSAIPQVQPPAAFKVSFRPPEGGSRP
ncbi:hypothetical protein D3C79_1072670 [compost metagenome]